MTFAASAHRSGSATVPSQPAQQSVPGTPTGLGGNTVAQVVEGHCPGMQACAGVVIEHLDAQAGTWQCSTDGGRTWRAIRTDLINRPGNMGLALDSDARLRVLPLGGHRVQGVRLAFHAVQRSHGDGNGSYRAYADEDREDGARTVTVVLALAAINGAPPAVHVPRPRNKRAMVRAAAQAPAPVAAAGALALA